MRSTFTALLGLLAAANACTFTVCSSTVGCWTESHGPPSVFGGAAQIWTWSHGSCSFTGNIQNGCGLIMTNAKGCGTLSYTSHDD